MPSRAIAELSVAVVSRFSVSPNSYRLRCAAGFNAGGPMRVSCRPKFDLPSEPSRSRSVLKPRKSRLLSVTSNAPRPAHCPACPPFAQLLVGSCVCDEGDIVLLLHALDQLVDQFDPACPQPTSARAARVCDRSNISPAPALGAVPRADHRACGRSPESAHKDRETRVEQIVRERLQQVFDVHLGGQVAGDISCSECVFI